MKKIEIDYFGKKVSMESGRMAKQADGSVIVSYGDTKVLVTAVSEKKAREGADFFPLTCMYIFKAYSKGKIPGGFIKRENRLSDHETFISRLIDRPIRPLFPEGYSNDTQVIATVISCDPECSPIACAMMGASAAVHISDIPFQTPVAGVTVGRINGEFVVNPTEEEEKNSELSLFMVVNSSAIVMVESEAKQVEEALMVEALEFGFKAAQPLIELQEQLRAAVGKEKRAFQLEEHDPAIVEAVSKVAIPKINEALGIKTKMERYAALDQAKAEIVEHFVSENEDEGFDKAVVKDIISSLKKKIMRENILDGKERVDGRTLKEVRDITCELGVLPRAHGSALFTRGETQALVVTTLGSKDDEQMVDDPTGFYAKKFYLHYNFPPYSVGETGRIGGPGRRELGHGRLAERGLSAVLTLDESFPYTVRIVSEIMESNGSSSMASVCGGSLSMMDAGVPIEAPVAGIAMGLVQEGDRSAILTDILGDEDHVGDMDFKVVGTEKGISALQMDIKIDGLSMETLRLALDQAKEGRLHILNKMGETIQASREELSSTAPQFYQHKVPESKIKDIIGPGGRIIKGITADSGAKVQVQDDGMVNIYSSDRESAQKALKMVQDLVREAEIGTTYDGTVKKITDFGAFVEILPGLEGLVHISEIAKERVERVEDHLSEGQMVRAKAVGFDKRGKLKLSMKSAD